jgi:hypothetical protein
MSPCITFERLPSGCFMISASDLSPESHLVATADEVVDLIDRVKRGELDHLIDDSPAQSD